jgi:hypothetical protein
LVLVEASARFPDRAFRHIPAPTEVAASEYRERLSEVAAWEREPWICGVLVPVETRLIDLWLVSQLIVEGTERLSPLVALQPVSMIVTAPRRWSLSRGRDPVPFAGRY